MAQTVSSPKRNFRWRVRVGVAGRGALKFLHDICPRSFAIRGEIKAFEMLSSTNRWRTTSGDWPLPGRCN